jgi:ribonucleoside-diphosphate reductase alpha chain
VKTGDVDFGDKALRLKSFKEIIKSNHTTDFYTDAINLRDKVFEKFKSISPKKGMFRERPHELDGKLFYKKIGGKIWCFVIGYLLGKPFEIFSAPEYSEEDEYGFLFPKTVTNGVIIKWVINGELRYDFRYQNKRGFKTTLEGLNYNVTPDITNFCSIISGMIQGRVDMDTTIGRVGEMKVSDKKYKIWNKEAMKVLSAIK